MTLNGKAKKVGGSCPSLSFELQGREVTTNGSTRFNGSCGDIKKNTDLSVTGTVSGNGAVIATSVDVKVKGKDDDDDEDKDFAALIP